MPKLKRRLTELEIESIREWMSNAPQGRKPSMKQIARRFKVSRPSIVKSLGGDWKTFKGGVILPPPKPKPIIPKTKIITNQDASGGIEPFTTDLGADPLV